MDLNNNGDGVFILDRYDYAVDAVSWGNSLGALIPAVPLTIQGYSIERFPMDQDTDTATDWRSQSNPNPGE